MSEHKKSAFMAIFILVFSIIINTDNDISRFLSNKSEYLVNDLDFCEDTAIKVGLSFSKQNAENEFALPLKNPIITSVFGERVDPITYEISTHNGLDLTSVDSFEVYAICDGEVVERGFDNGYGNYIVLQHSNGYKSLYAHLSSYLDNNSYKKGEILGYMGSTGKSTGTHLHISISKDDKVLDPEVLLYEN